ncbi:hypothetical protein A2875_02735 [Candidatus Gottesmanbacteria bacterium RIFCSPHIGHO2_01_FULL_46_14]|uniref:DUF5615 domain-containing protein n=2 Tax=Candidatus Gottesmaniibacteriota TaxID=1752720 RepID=A0A1F5ZPT7_9BACT|nr:MAG: hypothetical protein A2875_02735 [Candidatus Gottesmanbacteria bacterium RIFCSPHIGHO2_01_FULL_46_14]OGG28560.1 MAG: hypothetical protein A2971_03695 [Candidatus Gottesmanbacteria bacterium RIFCSPLOWO2_01_FULL_46_21]
MNAVIDEDLHRSLGSHLSSLGFTSLDVRDHGLRGASDEEVFLFAQKRKAILFSADLGFANTLSYRVQNHCGVVILRYPNELSTNAINEDIRLLLSKLIHEDYDRSLIILSPGKLRIRRNQ